MDAHGRSHRRETVPWRVADSQLGQQREASLSQGAHLGGDYLHPARAKSTARHLLANLLVLPGGGGHARADSLQVASGCAFDRAHSDLGGRLVGMKQPADTPRTRSGRTLSPNCPCARIGAKQPLQSRAVPALPLRLPSRPARCSPRAAPPRCRVDLQRDVGRAGRRVWPCRSTCRLGACSPDGRSAPIMRSKPSPTRRQVAVGRDIRGVSRGTHIPTGSELRGTRRPCRAQRPRRGHSDPARRPELLTLVGEIPSPNGADPPRVRSSVRSFPFNPLMTKSTRIM